MIVKLNEGLSIFHKINIKYLNIFDNNRHELLKTKIVCDIIRLVNKICHKEELALVIRLTNNKISELF